VVDLAATAVASTLFLVAIIAPLQSADAPAALTLVFAGLQAQLTHHGADLMHGNILHKEHMPEVAQELVQLIAVNSGWAVQLWATEIYSQVAVAVQLYHMALAVGADGAPAAKYWSLSNKESKLNGNSKSVNRDNYCYCSYQFSYRSFDL
jgi:hypothetical protein